MTKIRDINENAEHIISEVVCLKCLRRWIAERPHGTMLIDLECPQCHEQGYTIETGEELMCALCQDCKNFKNFRCKLGIEGDWRYRAECEFFQEIT